MNKPQYEQVAEYRRKLELSYERYADVRPAIARAIEKLVKAGRLRLVRE